MWPFSKIKKLEHDNKEKEVAIGNLKEEINRLKMDTEEIQNHYKKILSNEFTEEDIKEIFSARLNFLDERMDELERHNVPEIASQLFLRKQESRDMYIIFLDIIKNKEEKKKKSIEECVKNALKQTI